MSNDNVIVGLNEVRHIGQTYTAGITGWSRAVALNIRGSLNASYPGGDLVLSDDGREWRSLSVVNGVPEAYDL